MNEKLVKILAEEIQDEVFNKLISRTALQRPIAMSLAKATAASFERDALNFSDPKIHHTVDYDYANKRIKNWPTADPVADAEALEQGFSCLPPKE